jgi:hypothetical protein
MIPRDIFRYKHHRFPTEAISYGRGKAHAHVSVWAGHRSPRRSMIRRSRPWVHLEIFEVAAAERDYGVIITEPLQLDEAATEACRCARKEAMSQRKAAEGEEHVHADQLPPFAR